MPTSDSINIRAISETHIDNSFDDTAGAIQGYTIYRKDRNAYGGGVAVYVQNHIPVKLREDLMSNVVVAGSPASSKASSFGVLL